MDVVEPGNPGAHQGNSTIFGGALESFPLGALKSIEVAIK
jgi:hypothetical protein